jgi:GH25 family lysozyme M1 (1,4-beta-N-acetylmuramidase)
MRVTYRTRLLTRRRWSSLAAAVLCITSLGTLAAGARADAPTFPAGLDLSHHQHDAGPFDWAQIMTSAPTFAISKATEGTTFLDPQFASDYAAEKTNNIARGSFDYAQPGLPISTAIAQADFYATTIGTVQEIGDLPPVLDLEVPNGLEPRDLISWTQTFLGELMAKTGRVPMISTGRNFWRTSLLNSSAFVRYPLWIADYTPGATAPTAPLIGGWPTWTMWQWSGAGTLPGITGPVDLDYFNGTAATLAGFANGSAPSVLTPAAPTAPINVTAAPAGNALTVTWVPSDNGGVPLSAYTVTLSPGGAILTVPGTQTSAVIPGLDSSTLYTATVVAQNTVGSSPASLPSAPSGATVGVVPVTMTATTPTPIIASGHNATLTGILTRTDGLGPVPAVWLTIEAKQTGAAGFTPIGTVATSATGVYTFPVAPKTTTRYSILYAGGAGWSATSASLLMTAQVNLTTVLSKAKVSRNSKVILHGGVSVAAAGRVVVRQRWYSNAWHSGPGTRVGKTGHYTFTLTPTTKGKTKFRVILSSKPGLVGSYSPTVVLTVR